MEQLTRFQGRAVEVDVLRQLSACLGNPKTALSCNLKEKKKDF